MEKDIMPFEKEQLSQSSLDRITAMALQKAGAYEKESRHMKDNNNRPVITMTGRESNRSDENVYESTVRSRRGGLVAACIAFLLVGTAGTFLLISDGVKTAPQKDPAAQFRAIGLDSADTTDSEQSDESEFEVETTTVTAETPDSSDVSEETTDSVAPDESESEVETTSVTEETSEPEVVLPDSVPDTEQVTVPNLVGFTRNRATAILGELGLNCEIEIINKGENGTVMEQSIAPDTVVDKGSMITLYVSAGDPEFVEMTMEIPIPKGAKGCYVIDVYREGSIAYTMTIEDASKYAGSTITLDIAGDAKETLTVYAKKFDAGYDNYVRYADYNVDYDTKTAELKGELNEKEFLDPPKLWDDLSGFDDLG